MIFIDNTHYRMAFDEMTNKQAIVVAAAVCIIVALVAFRMGVRHKKQKRGYEQLSIEDESVERTSLCRVTKMSSKKKFSTIRAQGDNDETASKSTANGEPRV